MNRTHIKDWEVKYSPEVSETEEWLKEEQELKEQIEKWTIIESIKAYINKIIKITHTLWKKQ